MSSGNIRSRFHAGSSPSIRARSTNVQVRLCFANIQLVSQLCIAGDLYSEIVVKVGPKAPRNIPNSKYVTSISTKRKSRLVLDTSPLSTIPPALVRVPAVCPSSPIGIQPGNNIWRFSAFNPVYQSQQYIVCGIVDWVGFSNDPLAECPSTRSSDTMFHA